MSTLVKTYHRLLIDISKLSGCTLCIPENIELNWVLIEGPSLDRNLLDYLEQGKTYQRVAFEAALPKWLKPLWIEFSTKGEDPIVLGYLRQALVFGYKASFEPTQQQIDEAQASFVNTDQQCGKIGALIDFDTVFWRTARAIVSRVIGDIRWHDIVPAHGPGAVCPKYDPVDRSNFNTIHDEIEKHYPFWDYFFGLPGFIPSPNEVHQMDIAQDSSPIRAKLVAVPKDSRGPRLICVHPRESIWIQQGQRLLLESAIAKHLGSSISFDDQSVNGQLALTSSKDRSFSTIDLKDASDRLSSSVVRFLFGSAYDWISCSRAQEVTLLDGRVLKLQKWAPMGNALCFPVESLCFYAAVQAGIRCCRTYKIGVSALRDYERLVAIRDANEGLDTFTGSSDSAWAETPVLIKDNPAYRSRSRPPVVETYVFGDDILVPSLYHAEALIGLERFGLTVNSGKTFVNGSFRESCGVDAYKGIDITPTRMKTHCVIAPVDAISLCTLAKNLRIKGYSESSASIYSYVRTRGFRLPLTNNPQVSGICEWGAWDLGYLIRNEPSLKWDTFYHEYQIPVLQARASFARTLSGRHHLLDSLLRLVRTGPSVSDLDEFTDKTLRSLAREGLQYPVPSRLNLKKGWTSVWMT